MPAAATSLLGKMLLGRYRVLRHLADGGMGSIYLARNEGAAGFVRPVVVKVLLPGLVADPGMVEMFMREARIMATLRHPSIVSVIDFAQERDLHVMVLDYVHGYHLGRWHRFVGKTRGPFPVEIAIHVILQVLRGLHYAHTLKGPDGSPLNIVHRDVTPSNILIDVDGHTKLADFGIARMNTDKTQGGKHAIKGKFPYLAPELIDGAEPAATTDVYAVGATLHEVLIGRNEFRAPNIAAEISRVINHVPTRLADVRGDVSPELSDVVARALAKAPAERFRSAAEFADALAAVQQSTENEAARHVAAMASEDFRDPRMTAVLSTPSLDDLASSWNTPTPVSATYLKASLPAPNEVGGDDTEGGRERSDDSDDSDLLEVKPYDAMSPPADTVALTPRASAEAVAAANRSAATLDAAAAVAARHAQRASTAVPAKAPPRRVPWGPIVMGLGLVVVGAIGVIALVQSRQPAPDQGAYVVVDQRAPADAGAAGPADAGAAAIIDASEAADASVAAAAAGAGAGSVVTIDAGVRRPSHDAGAAAAADTVKDLTRAFGKQMGRVHGCFQAHIGDADGTTNLALRFHVEIDGRVAEAELVPASLATTPLGNCLLGIARATRFGALEKPMTFRVPLRASVKPE